MTFESLQIHPDLLKAVHDAGFTEPTEIQKQCFEPGAKGQDIVGISQTGTGKTVAFLLPVLQQIIEDDSRSVLILTPTRELCVQITEEAQMLTKAHPLRITSIYGGEGYTRQEKDLKENPHVIVATPGRLIDYLKQGLVPADRIKHLILDEADRMFDMGFIRDIRFIMKRIPVEHTMLFSATLSYYVMRLAWDFMKDPVEIRIESETLEVDKIDQHLYHLGDQEKLPYLVNQILDSGDMKAIVFTNYKRKIHDIVKKLAKHGIHATGISSLLDQKKRIRLLKNFKLGKYKVLVATDVASRGIDVDDITHVFNYDLPQDAESYVHRIGRTARAGREGISYSYCSEYDFECLPRIESLLKHKIPSGDVNPDWVSYPKGDFEEFKDHGLPDKKPLDRNQRSDRQQRSRNQRGKGPERPPAHRDSQRKNQSKRRRKSGDSANTVRDQDRARLLGKSTDSDEESRTGTGQNRSGRQNRRPRNRQGERNRRPQREKTNTQRNQSSESKSRRPADRGEKKKSLWGKIKSIFGRKK